MGLMRNAFHAGSRSAWLRERAMRSRVVRRSVSRFMPGEALDDALQATRALQQQGAGTVLTQLGENIEDASEAEAVRRHYLEVLDLAHARGLDAQISVKPTQLGLDLDRDLCLAHLKVLVERAEKLGNFVWIDMESSAYVDATLELFRKARASSSRVGVCLQAYLRRTPSDMEALLPLRPALRLVKGAYQEPADVAVPRKADVDEAYFALARRALGADGGDAAEVLAIGTHDPRLIDRLRATIAERGLPRSAYEFEMLYGIQRPLQARLVEGGDRLRVLISYGSYWFPWYMRRLAERPANVGFVVRNFFSG
jgi:proline dehydrogenase